MNFNIPLDEVEQLDFDDYNLMLFTIFNEATLKLGGKFQYNTPDEQADDILHYADLAKQRGLDL